MYLGKIATVSFRVAKSKSTGKCSLGAKTGSLLNRRVGRESGKRIFSKAERKTVWMPLGKHGELVRASVRSVSAWRPETARGAESGKPKAASARFLQIGGESQKRGAIKTLQILGKSLRETSWLMSKTCCRKSHISACHTRVVKRANRIIVAEDKAKHEVGEYVPQCRRAKYSRPARAFDGKWRRRARRPRSCASRPFGSGKNCIT